MESFRGGSRFVGVGRASPSTRAVVSGEVGTGGTIVRGVKSARVQCRIEGIADVVDAGGLACCSRKLLASLKPLGTEACEGPAFRVISLGIGDVGETAGK